MDEKTLAAISLSNRDFPSWDAKMREVIAWIELAAGQGVDLIALPEASNLYYGDGPGYPNPPTFRDIALRDWQRDAAPLIDAAKRLKITLALAVCTLENDRLTNSIFYIDRRGQTLGRFEKMRPTNAELDEGIKPGGAQPLIEWEGLKIGGGICFDTNFQNVFESQAQRGADFFVVSSLWPGGSHLNFYALQYSTPIVLAYPAWSRIIDITGQEIAAGGYRSETLRFGFGAPVVMATINFDRVVLHADQNQQKIVEVQQKHGKDVRVSFDQQNCLYFLESRSDRVTAKEVMQEFGLIERKDYLAACDKRCATME